MNKSDIEQIVIEIECNGESALSMMLHRDGTLNRSGNGSLPRHKVMVMGMSDGTAFRTLIAHLNENIFPHAGTYDLKVKKGFPVMYRVAFLGKDKPIAVFEFRMGLENKDAGNLVAYLDALIQEAVKLTENWYNETLKKHETPA